MVLHLTPAMLEAAYELLRTTPPFRRWQMLPSDDIEFVVTRKLDDCATCWARRVRGEFVWRIEISTAHIGSLATLLATMAHEMIHIHEEDVHQEGGPRARNDIAHSQHFKRWAKHVCRHHGFDEKLF